MPAQIMVKKTMENGKIRAPHILATRSGYTGELTQTMIYWHYMTTHRVLYSMPFLLA